jgi:ATP:ADP antiporter, AAA family
MIVIGQTAGAPLGAFIAGRLFSFDFSPQTILQISAVLLLIGMLLYLAINARVPIRARTRDVLPPGGGFGLVLKSGYLRTVAMMMVLLNGVNTTGEYFVSHLVTEHARVMSAVDPTFNARAYIGSFFGSYQFWVNVGAFVLQAFVTSRLVKHRGLRGVLLLLPLIALGGYSLIAAGVSFAVVRWIKTAENATDYSIMNTARQLLWLPTSREEKYKAKQAIDTFFVRTGDLLSAAIVFLGTSVTRLTIGRFALVNVALTLIWVGIALAVLRRHEALLQRRAEAA